MIKHQFLKVLWKPCKMCQITIFAVQFSRSVVSDSLRPHELQHARPPCPSPTPSVHPNSCPSSWWCHPAISSSVIPFSSCPQSLPASVFPNESTLRMRWPKYWSFSFSISPSKEHPGLTSFRMDWLDLLAVQGTLRSLLQHHSSTASLLRRSAFFTVQLSHFCCSLSQIHQHNLVLHLSLRLQSFLPQFCLQFMGCFGLKKICESH